MVKVAVVCAYMSETQYWGVRSFQELGETDSAWNPGYLDKSVFIFDVSLGGLEIKQAFGNNSPSEVSTSRWTM